MTTQDQTKAGQTSGKSGHEGGTDKRFIWITVTDKDGVIIDRVDVGEYDFSKSFARAELWDTLQSAINYVKRQYPNATANEHQEVA